MHTETLHDLVLILLHVWHCTANMKGPSKTNACMWFGRESRYFNTWKHVRQIQTFKLPLEMAEITGQRTCPIGEHT